MYDQIKAHMDKVHGVGVDARVVQEIADYFYGPLEVQELSEELLGESETLYYYLTSGRAVFGGGR